MAAVLVARRSRASPFLKKSSSVVCGDLLWRLQRLTGRVCADKNAMSSEDDIFKKDLEETLPLGRGVRVLAADAVGIFALEKPAGTQTHPNAPGVAAAKNALLVADYSLKAECYFCRISGGCIRKVFILNRLDAPTSGVVLAATDERVALAVRRAFLAGSVRKVYAAVVCGSPVPGKGIWKDFLRRVRMRDGSLRVEAVRATTRDAMFAETHFSVIRAGTLNTEGVPAVPGALLRLEPKTGRTHQLRVQCALRKIPILGDRTYGDFYRNARWAEGGVSPAKNRLFLHAGETEVVFPWRGKSIRFFAESALPAEFNTAVR